MSTLRIAFIPGVIAGVISVLTSWFWMGVIFHRYQRETPETWRPEGSRSYIAASLLHILAAIGIACLFTLVVRFQMGLFAIGFQGSFYFAICILGCPGATDSSRIRHLGSSPSPCCHRPTSRLAHHFRAPFAPLYGGRLAR